MKTWICLLGLLIIMVVVQESASAEIRLRPSDYRSTVESGVSTTLDYILDNQQKDTVYNVVVYLEKKEETPDWLRWEPVQIERLLPYEHYDISWELDVPFHRFSQYYDVKFRIEYGEEGLDSEKETLWVNPPRWLLAQSSPFVFNSVHWHFPIFILPTILIRWNLNIKHERPNSRAYY